MIDPQKLVHSSRMVYGDEVFTRIYGEIPPIPAERVILTEEHMLIHLGGRSLQVLHTPGHARHHLCLWDEQSRGLFTGDAFGISYRECDTEQSLLVFPATTPTQFDPDAMCHSIERMASLQPDWLYLTHFGQVAYTKAWWHELDQGVREWMALARSCHDLTHIPAERHRRIVYELGEWFRRKHSALAMELLTMDIELNAQGLASWLDRTDDKH